MISKYMRNYNVFYNVYINIVYERFFSPEHIIYIYFLAIYFIGEHISDKV